jgi:energy-coupling factor transport system permease protein
MQLRRATIADPTAFLPAADAVAKLGAAMIVAVVAFLSRDPVTPAILLAGIAVAIPGAGMRARDLARLLGPLVVAAVLLGGLNALLAGTSAVAPAAAGPTGRAWVGLALGLRIAAIALASSLALATTDPADLASGLIGHLRFPPRLAIGALASLRMAPILATEWSTIALARRARGVDAGRNPLVTIRLALTALVILLVSAIRRASRMALAMDARGFASGIPRTLARPPRMRRPDWLLLAAALVLGFAAIAISVALGTYVFLLG